MAEEIRTRFKSVRLHNHWPCTVCGGQTSGVNVLNESPDGTVRVCEHCLQAGHIDERLAMHAQQLEEQAQKNSLIDWSSQGADLRGVDSRRGAR